jgi:hypothetical protein
MPPRRKQVPNELGEMLVTCRVPTSIFDALNDEAKRQFRTINAQVAMILAQWVDNNLLAKGADDVSP